MGSRPPLPLPATRTIAPSSPFQVFWEAMFSLKPWGNLFTLDCVVFRAAKVGSSKNAVRPTANNENAAIHNKSTMNFLKFFSVSLLGRGARFYLVSLVLMFFGEAVKKHLEAIILLVSIIIIIFCVIIYKKSIC